MKSFRESDIVGAVDTPAGSPKIVVMYRGTEYQQYPHYFSGLLESLLSMNQDAKEADRQSEVCYNGHVKPIHER